MKRTIDMTLTPDGHQRLLAVLKQHTNDSTDGVLSKALILYSTCVEAVRAGSKVKLVRDDGEVVEINFAKLTAAR